jgi:hypothetical protein
MASAGWRPTPDFLLSLREIEATPWQPIEPLAKRLFELWRRSESIRRIKEVDVMLRIPDPVNSPQLAAQLRSIADMLEGRRE